MKKTARVALGFAAAIAAAPAFAECPAHSGTTAQAPSTPVPLAQSTAPTSTPTADATVVLTQNGTVPGATTEAQ